MTKIECSVEGWKCPKCGNNHFSDSGGMTTLAYYQPTYKDGKNVNPDRNTTSFTRHCIACNTSWGISGNDHDGYNVSKYGEVVIENE